MRVYICTQETDKSNLIKIKVHAIASKCMSSITPALIKQIPKYPSKDPIQRNANIGIRHQSYSHTKSEPNRNNPLQKKSAL